MKILALALVASGVVTVILGFVAVPLLSKLKAGQPILKYVETHKEKSGTPTMGGLFFIIPSAACFFIFGGGGRMASVAVVIGLAYMLVGFIDDFIKVKYRHNQGLKAYQKIIFQMVIAVIAGVFAFNNGLNVMHIPFSKESVDTGYFTIPIVAIVFLAVTNSVNLTDGLDGLASSVSVCYLTILVALVLLQTSALQFMYIKIEEYQNLSLLAVCLIGGLLGFLVFNVSRAKVFMGDTGSLALGGFIASISIFSSNTLFIPIIGIMFVLSSISVIVQVAHFKRTKKRVFLMTPLHHHFQLKGVSESKISYVYSLITLAVGLLTLLSYM